MGIKIVHFGHSCVLVDTGSARLLFDPGVFSTGFEELTDLDAILVTHVHADHVDDKKIAALHEANPGTPVVTDRETAAEAARLGLAVRVARPDDILELGGARVEVVGGLHAQIHPEIPVPPNLGYLVDDGAFYHPGDSLFVPHRPVDVLGLPTGAPWLKLGEAVDFYRAVKPRVAVPIHEMTLSQAGIGMSHQRFQAMSPAGASVAVLTHGEPAQV